MNIFCRMPDSENGFVSDILEELRLKGTFDRCVVTYSSKDDKDVFDSKYYRPILNKNGHRSVYDEICDWNDIPSVPTYVWEGLRKYKGTILNLTRRPYFSHILNYEEMERIYIRNIKFWNYILDTEKIEMCFFCCTPHTVWEYSIYALAKIKRIPMLIAQTTNIAGLYDVGTDIDRVGIGVLKYSKMINDISMNEEERKYYETVVMSKTSTSNSDYEIRKKNKYYRISGWKHIPLKRVIGMELSYQKLKHKREQFSIHEYEYNVRHCIDKHVKFRKLKSTEYYEQHIAEDVDINEKFILYLLQFVPESNTLPQAGELANQLLAISVLADGAKRAGVKLYVKEHWEQLAREKDFYDDLKKIPNVYCVKMSESTTKYVEKSIAVCSQTGSVLVESLLNCKPRITTVRTAMTYAPGSYFVEDSQGVEAAISDINSGIDISRDESIRYFISLFRNTLRLRLDVSDKVRADVNTIKREYCMIIMDFIENGMTDSYCFIRKNNI